MDPWGTPEKTFWKLLCTLFIQMHCFASTEHVANFAINRSCGTQSKAFDKSPKTTPTPVLGKLIFKKMLKFVLLDNLFPDVSAEV